MAAYDQAAMAMWDSSTAVLSFPSRPADPVENSLLGSGGNGVVADEVNHVNQGLDFRQQESCQSSFRAYAQQQGSQSAVNSSSEYSVIQSHPSAGKRLREQGAELLPTVAEQEAGPHPKLARLGTQLQLGQHEQLLQRRDQLQHEQQQQQGFEQQHDHDMGVGFTEELLPSSGGAADFYTGVQPLHQGMGESGEIYFAGLF
ncbi:unnamed protein product [Calypogeia fissa]